MLLLKSLGFMFAHFICNFDVSFVQGPTLFAKKYKIFSTLFFITRRLFFVVLG